MYLFLRGINTGRCQNAHKTEVIEEGKQELFRNRGSLRRMLVKTLKQDEAIFMSPALPLICDLILNVISISWGHAKAPARCLSPVCSCTSLRILARTPFENHYEITWMAFSIQYKKRNSLISFLSHSESWTKSPGWQEL